MRFIDLVIIAMLGVAVQARAAEPVDGGLEEIVVTGEFAGPGLWRVTRADDPAAHVLWIVGDPWPLPRHWKWKSKNIEARVLESQEILGDSGITMELDERVGLLRGMALLPAFLGMRHNPDDARLADVLPADLYAEWLVQKKRYLGIQPGVEKYRPVFAAHKLRKAAFDVLDMREGGVVWATVEKIARKRKIKVTSPRVSFVVKRSELKDKAKRFARESLPDVECFAVTLQLTAALGRRDVENARAHAWAVGDLEALAALPRLPNPHLPCVAALMSSQVARETIPADIGQRATARWLEAVDASFASNPSTFAVIPLDKLIAPDGYVAKLRDRGYEVDEPR